MNDIEELAYKLWCEARVMEEKGNHEALDTVRNRAPYWFGQSTAFERAAWIVLGSSGQSVDAEFFTKADSARLAKITETT